MPNKRRQPQDRDQARPLEVSSALDAALARIRIAALYDAAGDLAPLATATAGRTRTIHDLDGRPLFHDVDLDGPDAPAGVIRLAASETIGSPLISIEAGPRRWDPDAALRNAPSVATALHPKARVRSTELVVYGYPKVGVRVSLDDRDRGGTTDVVLDASDLRPVVGRGADELEGSAAYSYYADIVEPELDRRTRRFARGAENVEGLRKSFPELFERDFVITPDLRERLDLAARRFWIIDQARVLPYAPRCNQAEDFALRAQQTNVFCAVATAQMILDWHRWYFTQDQIAAAMSTGAGGTTNPNQVTGYETLTGGAFDATFDGAATWAEAKAEIDAGRPLKSGIPGHARACAGYRRTHNLFTHHVDLLLRIYDPWPWNADICQGGAVYWEDWDAVQHTNWIYVRHA
jgi:hypothetical protein